MIFRTTRNFANSQSQFSCSMIVPLVSSAVLHLNFVNFQTRNVSHSKILLFKILTLIQQNKQILLLSLLLNEVLSHVTHVFM